MKLRLLFALLSIALLAGTAAAQVDGAAVGSAGEYYQLQTGAYGELFPLGAEAAPDSRVMALDIRRADGGERLLVPGTEDVDSESWSAILVDPRSDRLFLVWESQHNGIHPLLHLVSFDGTAWSPLTEVTHNPFVPKSSPRLLVTRDEYRDDEAHRRAVLHLVWTEETDPDGHASYYAALSLEDGAFLGSSPIYHLGDLLAGSATVGEGGEIGGLSDRIEILPGRDARSAVVVFTSPPRGEVVSLQLDTLPLELVSLADEARAKIIDIGARQGSRSWTAIADELHAELLAGSSAFHPEIVRAIADEARAKIIDIGFHVPGADLRSVAAEARAKIIDIGIKLSDRGLRHVQAALGAMPAAILDLTPGSVDATTRQLASARIVSRRALPSAAIGAEPFLVASADGSELAIAWVDGQRLSYVESRGEGWSETLGLPFSAAMGVDQARALLQRRLNGR